MSQVPVPRYHELMWPALQAATALGGAASVGVLKSYIVEERGLPREVLSVRHGRSRVSELDYRFYWALRHLEGIGAIEQRGRGVWAITDHGRH
ncbi:MAG TPA: winged helix-turn-helix domain-containing protein, partial [Actinomycetota bacterium]|nr:winged helix-turn-helix domain-containing protein [Actinomycetota bacterium]